MDYFEQLQMQKDLYFIYKEEIFRKLDDCGVKGLLEGNEKWLLNYLQDTDAVVRCIDEGAEGGVHVAGSGVLLDEDAAIALLQKTKGATTHAGCGAAGIFYQRNKAELDARFPGLSPDQHAERRVRELCELAGVPYHGHIGHTTMRRPREFHPARVAYYDGTDKFNNLTRTGQEEDALLPQGFVVSRAVHRNAENALDEAALTVQIATGQHGFGQLISLEHPFWIIAIGDPEHPDLGLDMLMQELENHPAILDFMAEGLVRIDGFTSPVPGDAPWR